MAKVTNTFDSSKKKCPKVGKNALKVAKGGQKWLVEGSKKSCQRWPIVAKPVKNDQKMGKSGQVVKKQRSGLRKPKMPPIVSLSDPKASDSGQKWAEVAKWPEVVESAQKCIVSLLAHPRPMAGYLPTRADQRRQAQLEHWEIGKCLLSSVCFLPALPGLRPRKRAAEEAEAEEPLSPGVRPLLPLSFLSS